MIIKKGIILLMCSAMIFVNYKLFHSTTWQGYLMYDYNSHTLNLPFDLAVKINNKFPNVTLTTLPIKFLQARYYREIDSMDDQFIHNQLSYTPNDCALLWEEIESVFEDIIDIEDHSPDEYFPKKLISLNDCKQYELFLKDKLIELTKGIDFSELCITSGAKIERINESDSGEVLVKTIRAEGQKCPVCWKINKKPCERHFS